MEILKPKSLWYRLVHGIMMRLQVLFQPRLAGLILVAFNITPSGVVFSRVGSNRIQYSNKAFRKKTKWSTKELRKKDFMSFVHQEDWEETEEQASSEVIRKFRNRWIKKGGGIVEVEWVAVTFNGWWIAFCEFDTPKMT